MKARIMTHLETTDENGNDVSGWTSDWIAMPAGYAGRRTMVLVWAIIAFDLASNNGDCYRDGGRGVQIGAAGCGWFVETDEGDLYSFDLTPPDPARQRYPGQHAGDIVVRVGDKRAVVGNNPDPAAAAAEAAEAAGK